MSDSSGGVLTEFEMNEHNNTVLTRCSADLRTILNDAQLCAQMLNAQVTDVEHCAYTMVMSRKSVIRAVLRANGIDIAELGHSLFEAIWRTSNASSLDDSLHLSDRLWKLLLAAESEAAARSSATIESIHLLQVLVRGGFDPSSAVLVSFLRTAQWLFPEDEADDAV